MKETPQASQASRLGRDAATQCWLPSHHVPSELCPTLMPSQVRVTPNGNLAVRVPKVAKLSFWGPVVGITDSLLIRRAAPSLLATTLTLTSRPSKNSAAASALAFRPALISIR